MQQLREESVQVLEKQSGLSQFRVREGQVRLLAFLNAYERAVYRLRDGGLAVNFDFEGNGNYREWKRLDTDLLSSVRDLVSQSRYSFIRGALNSSIWKDGVRHLIYKEGRTGSGTVFR